MFGGETTASRSILAYNSLTDSWRKLGLELPDPANSPGDNIQAVSCPAGGGIFLLRNTSCYWLDWRTKQFSLVGSFEVKTSRLSVVDISVPQRRGPAIVECGGDVHLLGGDFLTTWTVFRPARPGQAWGQGGPSPRRGRTEASAAVLGEELYLVGGQVRQTRDTRGGEVVEVVGDCEKYDRVRQCWVVTRPLLTPRTRAGCAVVEEEIYVVGGEDGEGRALAACEKFSPRTGLWTRLADLTQARRSPVTVVLEQVVFVVGGDTDTAEWYDEESQTWVTTSRLPHILQGAGGAVLNTLLL